MKKTIKKVLAIILTISMIYGIVSTFFYGYNDWNNLIFIPMIALMVLQ